MFVFEGYFFRRVFGPQSRVARLLSPDYRDVSAPRRPPDFGIAAYLDPMSVITAKFLVTLEDEPIWFENLLPFHTRVVSKVAKRPKCTDFHI